jgi:hypothetical protein
VTEETSKSYNDGDIQLGFLEKDSDRLISSIEEGNMTAVLSQNELMYTFIFKNKYQCFIHQLDAPEGRHKAWDINERNRAMLKNLTSVADKLVEKKFKPDMDFMGVMAAAEKGIINYLDISGQLPAEDYDFMAPLENKEEQNI